MAIRRADVRSSRAQRGISSVLILLLTGLALGAVVMGATGNIRGTQSQAVTLHAVTQAQMRTWSGVEVMRQFLNQAGATAATLPTGAVTMTGVTGISANITSVLPTDANCVSGSTTGTRVTVEVTGTSGSEGAAANSTAEVVYCVYGSAGGAATTTYNGGPMNLVGDVLFSGDVKVSGSTGAKVYVDGAVTTKGSVEGFDMLYATGNITLDGDCQASSGKNCAGTIATEGNLVVSNTGTYDTLNAMGSVTISNVVKANTINAGTTTSVSNTLTVTSQLNSKGSVTFTGYGGTIAALNTQGDMTSKGQTVSNLMAQGTYKWSSSPNTVTSGKIGVAPSSTLPTTANITVIAGLSVPVTTMTKETISVPRVDARTLKASAHYAYEVISGVARVSIRSINGIPDTTTTPYYMVVNSSKTYACTSSTYAAGSCYGPIANGAVTFAASTGVNTASSDNYKVPYTWTLPTGYSAATVAMPPGIIWVDGNLLPATAGGIYYNTLIATGNLLQQNEVRSPNYVGYAGTCTSAAWPLLYPKDMCNTTTSTFTPSPLANTAIMAGSYLADGTTFVGGTITMAAGNATYGNVVSADIVKASGSVQIHGFLLGAGQRSGVGQDSFAGGVAIDLSGAPSTFSATTMCTSSANCSLAAPVAASAKMLWSRYK